MRATALSQHGLYGPSNLINGNKNSFYASSDQPTVQPWVQLELETHCIVSVIKITNRVLCCGERLSDVEVRVGHVSATSVTAQQQGLSTNQLCGKFDGPGSNGQVVLIECSPPITGKYITIQIKDTSVHQMNVGEVEVLGYSAGKFKGLIIVMILYKFVLKNVVKLKI